MNFATPKPQGTTRNGAFRHFGGLHESETGAEHSVTVDLCFRMATNGVIVNTKVNDTPIITTSAGLFR
jgi:hypothetical protein